MRSGSQTEMLRKYHLMGDSQEEEKEEQGVPYDDDVPQSPPSGLYYGQEEYPMDVYQFQPPVWWGNEVWIPPSYQHYSKGPPYYYSQRTPVMGGTVSQSVGQRTSSSSTVQASASCWGQADTAWTAAMMQSEVTTPGWQGAKGNTVASSMKTWSLLNWQQQTSLPSGWSAHDCTDRWTAVTTAGSSSRRDMGSSGTTTHLDPTTAWSYHDKSTRTWADAPTWEGNQIMVTRRWTASSWQGEPKGAWTTNPHGWAGGDVSISTHCDKRWTAPSTASTMATTGMTTSATTSAASWEGHQQAKPCERMSATQGTSTVSFVNYYAMLMGRR